MMLFIADMWKQVCRSISQDSLFAFDCTITLLHFVVVEHSVKFNGCQLAIMQNSLPLWSFVHSGPLHPANGWMRWCLCVVGLRHALVENKLICIKAISHVSARARSCSDKVQDAETCMSADFNNLVSSFVFGRRLRSKILCSWT